MKKNCFGFEFHFFVSDVISGVVLGLFGPSSNPRPKLSDGSISFLLETRSKSKSFHTSDDLLAFRVQML